MTFRRLALALSAVIVLGGSSFALAQGNGNGKGRGGGGNEEPSGPFAAAYAYTLSGPDHSIYVADERFLLTFPVTNTSDGRIRGMDHAPDESRVLVEEFRALWETTYSVGEDGSLTSLNRTLLFDGGDSAAALQCIATGPQGAYAYSLTSAVGGELVVRPPGGLEKSFYNVGRLESCDFNSDGTVIAAIDNLPGAGGHELVTFDVFTGERTPLMFVQDPFGLSEVMVAPDDASFLISWTDRQTGTTVRKISEWHSGDSLPTNPVIAGDALHASFACDLNENGAVDDGYVFQSFAGRAPTWVHYTGGETTELIASKGNKDVYWLRPTC